LIFIREYSAPESIGEAYDLLMEKKKNVILGGGAFIRMSSKNIPNIIDLSKAKLDYITEEESVFNIGAMTTFGDIEHSKVLGTYFNNVLEKSIREIVGIQLRNIVTVGGTVYSRYGFSDLITGLLALDTKVNLYSQGSLSLEEFLKEGSKEKDILESITIKKDGRKANFLSMRNSTGDYAILNVAVSVLEGKHKIAVGARPGRGILATNAMKFLDENGITEKNAEEAGKMVSNELTFGTNSRGSMEYRKHVSSVLVKKALLEVESYED